MHLDAFCGAGAVYSKAIPVGDNPHGRLCEEEQHMRKRLLAVFLACCMAASTASTVFAADDLPALA